MGGYLNVPSAKTRDHAALKMLKRIKT